MTDFTEELFECPECGLKTKVIWDPGQESREVDCIHCRRDLNEAVPMVDADGEPVMSDSKDKSGNYTQALEYRHTKLGCRYKIERGKGVK